MKTAASLSLTLLLVLGFATSIWASSQAQHSIIKHNKKTAINKSLRENEKLSKAVEEKEAHAILLINDVAATVNDRYSSDIEKGDAQFAYDGFIARFEAIREERNALEQKEIMPDNATLRRHSKSLDRLISDINHFINR